MSEQTALSDDAWATFEARLRRYVRRRLDPASVDDAVGDILLRLARNQSELSAARNPLAWAMRVAANVVTDHHRRRAAERRALSAVETEEEVQQPPLERDDTVASEFSRCLIPFIQELPERYRDALLLVEIEGLTQAEAAARVGVSVSGMKSRVQRGRAKLKDALLRCCAVELDSRGGLLDYRRRSTTCGRSC